MIIVNSFEVNQEVWMLYENKVHSAKIVNVKLLGTISYDGVEHATATYRIPNPDITHPHISVEEQNLFASKEELIDSL